MFDELQWRLVGPFRAGRATSGVGHPRDRLVFFMGTAAGGVWKTTNAGIYWENVTDGYLHTGSIGAIAIAPSDPEVMYVGTGEACVRNDVVLGDGIYRSTNGGQMWEHAGLDCLRHVSRIRVHPHDPDRLYVAGLSSIFDRADGGGVYRSEDGGHHWERVLWREGAVGAADLTMDQQNPRILYATLWAAHRTPWSFTSGGSASGLFRSVDGGSTWTELTCHPGLPSGLKGRIGVALSPQRGRVWATVEALDGGLFCSDNGGETWRRTTGTSAIRQRPWYFSHVVPHPCDPDKIYMLALDLLQSIDGGVTFQPMMTYHGDHHDLWIDPTDSTRWFSAHDGGGVVSLDGGQSWSTILNQPTAQFYHVAVDKATPYRIYGAQQDSGTLSVPSRSLREAIGNAEWYDVGGGESGRIAVSPDNPAIVYAGNYNKLTRYDHRTGEARIISPWPEDMHGWPASANRHRFAWCFPVLLSSHDGRTLYTAAEVVFRSTDEGASWEEISPDLTRADASKMGNSGGPITPDNTSAEYHGTIAALVESPCHPGDLWVGTDDGRVQRRSDPGQQWVDVTPEQLPVDSWVCCVEASPHERDVAYCTAHRYQLGDPRPYVYRTRDGGRLWEPIVQGLPADNFVRVVRADPYGPTVLFAGAERGVYVSVDAGDTWQALGGNFPAVPVYELAITEDDVVAATHGRAFWILDDATPIRQWAQTPEVGLPRLFAPSPGVQWVTGRPFGRRKQGPEGQISLRNGVAAWRRRSADAPLLFLDAGTNPDYGVSIAYILRVERHQGPVVLSIQDHSGSPVAVFTSGDTAAGLQGEARWHVSDRPGFHRFTWDFRPNRGEREGVGALRPMVVPGEYVVTLTVNGETSTQPFRVLPDPRLHLELGGLEERHELLWNIWRSLAIVEETVVQWQAVARDVAHFRHRAGNSQEDAGQDHRTEVLSRVCEEQLTMLSGRGLNGGTPPGAPGSLDHKLSTLFAAVESNYGRPTSAARRVSELLGEQARAAQGSLAHYREGEIADWKTWARALL